MSTAQTLIACERYDAPDGFYGIVWEIESDRLVYTTPDVSTKAEVRWYIKRFVELNGQYRFETDEEFRARHSDLFGETS